MRNRDDLFISVPNRDGWTLYDGNVEIAFFYHWRDLGQFMYQYHASTGRYLRYEMVGYPTPRSPQEQLRTGLL